MNDCPCETRHDAVAGVRVTASCYGKATSDGRRRRPSGLWSICVSGDRYGDAVGFSLSKGGNATDADKPKEWEQHPYRPTITVRLALDGRFGDALLFTRS
jgi:hypothetical protein